MTEVNGDAERPDMQVLFERRDDGVHFEVANPYPILLSDEEAAAIGTALLRIAYSCKDSGYGTHQFFRATDAVPGVLEAA